VHEIGQVAAVIEDQVERLAVPEHEGLLNAPDILLVGLALPRVYRHSSFRYRCCRVILRAEYVAGRPLYLQYKNNFVGIQFQVLGL